MHCPFSECWSQLWNEIAEIHLLLQRYIYLTLGGFILAIVTMGPYSLLLFFSAVLLLLLIHCLHPMHIHQWTMGLQMCWQTCWHLYIQYQLYWLQETPDSRYCIFPKVHCMKTSNFIQFWAFVLFLTDFYWPYPLSCWWPRGFLLYRLICRKENSLVPFKTAVRINPSLFHF